MTGLALLYGHGGAAALSITATYHAIATAPRGIDVSVRVSGSRLPCYGRSLTIGTLMLANGYQIRFKHVDPIHGFDFWIQI